MKILYRLSDSGNLKNKLPFATKFFCLENFLKVFNPPDILIIADNCKEETIQMLKSKHREVVLTSLGNAKSWRFCVDYAIENFSPDEIVYLVEDDYLHLPGSPKIISEGITISDYVTLYDHPDKYLNKSQGGNPFVNNGGEKTRVLLTESTHWKITNSTTMTFAAKVNTLIQDKRIWWTFTEKWPNDFGAFKRLTGKGSIANYILGKNRKLISPVPGFATHVESNFLTPLRNWNEKIL